jgi:hypothetical protein
VRFKNQNSEKKAVNSTRENEAFLAVASWNCRLTVKNFFKLTRQVDLARFGNGLENGGICQDKSIFLEGFVVLFLLILFAVAHGGAACHSKDHFAFGYG